MHIKMYIKSIYIYKIHGMLFGHNLLYIELECNFCSVWVRGWPMHYICLISFAHSFYCTLNAFLTLNSMMQRLQLQPWWCMHNVWKAQLTLLYWTISLFQPWKIHFLSKTSNRKGYKIRKIWHIKTFWLSFYKCCCHKNWS